MTRSFYFALTLIVFMISLPAVAQQPGNCSIVLRYVDQPTVGQDRMLSQETATLLFGGVPVATEKRGRWKTFTNYFKPQATAKPPWSTDMAVLGKTAIDYLKAQRGLTSHQLAQLWIELTAEVHKRVGFISYMFRPDNDRYVFKGSLGHVLFIDSDGALYRTHTKLGLGQTLEIDYSAFKKISP